jgi:hypothetical protein
MRRQFGNCDSDAHALDLDRARLAIRQVAHCVRISRLPTTIVAIRAAGALKMRGGDDLHLTVPTQPDTTKRVRDAIRVIRRTSINSIYAKRIRAAYEKEFEALYKPRIHALVTGFRSTGLPVPVLSACGRGTQEIRFTQLLRHFLDPHEPHGLGTRLLEVAFAEEVRERGDEPVAWETAEVRAEVDLGSTTRSSGQPQGNALDLLVVAGDVAVLLEQKILSAENVVSQGREEDRAERPTMSDIAQLGRYSRAFKQTRDRLAPGAQRIVMIFLTPERALAKDPQSEWKSISHGDLIRRFLNADREKLSPVARHNLVTFLWDLTCGPLGLTHRLRAIVPMLERVVADADKGRLGQYFRWRRENHAELDLIMETLEILQEGI